jgi:hypothetical protein
MEDILKRWSLETTQAGREAIFQELKEAGKFPNPTWTNESWEHDTKSYPDIGRIDSYEDRKVFTERLLKKGEFAESKQESIAEQKARGVNPCDPDQEFELTPVQRFIGRFLSPQCPYYSALLYHGVGVGKTCAAITVAENYLEAYPRRSVFIVAPRNIQPGFRRTIFDNEGLEIPAAVGSPNVARGCTGNTYLKLAGVEFEKDRAVVVKRVEQYIKSRYTFLGYLQFWRYITDILKQVSDAIPEPRRTQQRIAVLRKEFSGRMLIIDEAHNLRDSPGETDEDNADAPGGDIEQSESQAGKKLTPKLLEVLQAANGMKLVLLTGTPMYNNYDEIIFLFRLLLENDKKAPLSGRDVFNPDGTFVKGGEEKLGLVASAYVSFMRGESPLSFPIRLKPVEAPALTAWPVRSPTAVEIPEIERTRILNLPFVPVEYTGASAEEYKKLSQSIIETKGLGIASIDEMVQGGNWMFPVEGQRVRDTGFDAAFEEVSSGSLTQFKSRESAKWLHRDQVSAYSPKTAFILKRIQTAQGVIFVYSRFIKSGALPLALALEANGYTPWSPDGSRRPLLADGIQDDKKRQCALCSQRESGHTPHAFEPKGFVPAKYVILTGGAGISPNNPAAIAAARGKENMDGGIVKVVIGSQVASEGIDLRFVREIYVFDSWFHLNKMEQVLGRGIRTCSHSLLTDVKGPDGKKRKRTNCTIHLLINQLTGAEEESADMYMYRMAMAKAIQVGRVTRILKSWALDCNLNRSVTVVKGLVDEAHVNAQGQDADGSMNDSEFTNICDWMEDCGEGPDGVFKCAIEVVPSSEDMSTYDEYAGRWHEVQIKRLIRDVFEKGGQPFIRYKRLEQTLEQTVPKQVLPSLLSEIIGNTSFRVTMGGKDGYILERNGFLLFQPFVLKDTRIPLALRVADVPLRRDVFEPVRVSAVKEVAPDAPAPSDAPADAAPSGENYWTSIKQIASIFDGGANFTEARTAALAKFKAQYGEGEKYTREEERLTMVGWLYDDMSDPARDYSDAERQLYKAALKRAFLEFIWDSLTPEEQMKLTLVEKGALELEIAREQLLKDNTVFRYMNPVTGKLVYMNTNASSQIVPSAEAVVKLLDTSDPMNSLRCDTSQTGVIYGFMVPKIKEGRLVFKTSTPPAVGGKPEKGAECAIVSTVLFHKQMLVGKLVGAATDISIASIMRSLGYKELILRKEIMYETDFRKLKKKEKKLEDEIKKGQDKTGELQSIKAEIASATAFTGELKLKVKERSFENVERACALNELILRWLDCMEESKPSHKKYFYRPVAAFKTKHLVGK